MVSGTESYARGMLGLMNIRTSDDLAKWAKSRGLLGVYIGFRPKTTYLKSAWQVVMPGGKTDPNAIAVNLGRKTFTFESQQGKSAAEQRAKDWADSTFAGGASVGWYSIEGFGIDLFPKSVVQELQTFLPDLVVWKKRQKSSRLKSKSPKSRKSRKPIL